MKEYKTLGNGLQNTTRIRCINKSNLMSHFDSITETSIISSLQFSDSSINHILYVRTILEQIGLPQINATTLYEDNKGALLMANAQQSTKRTRHMDIKALPQ